MGNTARLAARCLGRPVLMEPRELSAYAMRLREIDAQAFARPSRTAAIIRKLTMRSTPVAMEDDEMGGPRVPMEERLAYAPRYIGEADDAGYCWTLKSGVAMFCVNTPLLDEGGEDYCGVVYHGYDTLLHGMSEAFADDRVKAIWIKMKTPGGLAAPGIQALSAWMRAHRASAGGKPIWVFAEQMCSAGMWVGAQSDRIHAPRMGYVGSIGAYTLIEDDTAYLEKAGVLITEVIFPVDSEKTDGAPWKKLSPAAKANIQSEISQIGENFLSDMALGRPNLTREAMLAMNAGAFFAQAEDAARSGIALGLVDEIMTEEESFASMLRHISSPAIPNLPVAAPAGSATATPNKEQIMATKAEQKAASLAALNTEEAALKPFAAANAPRLAAIAAEKSKLEAGDGEKKDGDEDEAAPAAAAPAAATVLADDAEEEEEEEEEGEVDKISSSADAKAHPHMALAAIQSGQSFAQFQSSVKALVDAPRSRGALADAMAGSKRLGPDAATTKSGSGPGNMLVENASKRGGHKG